MITMRFNNRPAFERFQRLSALDGARISCFRQAGLWCLKVWDVRETLSIRCNI